MAAVLQGTVIVLAIGAIALYFGAPVRVLFRPSYLYLLGCLFFLGPGAFFGSRQMWQGSERADLLGAAALGLSVVLWFMIDSRGLPRLNQGVEPNVTRVGRLQLLLVGSLILKIFFDPDTIVGRVFTEVSRSEGWRQSAMSIVLAVPTALGAISVWIYGGMRKSGSRLRRLFAFLAFAIGLIAISRTPVFYVVLTFLLLVAWKHRRRLAFLPQRLASLIIVAALARAGVFVAAVLKGTNILAVSTSGDIRGNWSDVLEIATSWEREGAVSDVYGNFMFVIDNYPARYEYQPFLTVSTVALALVPRDWIPWKPMTASYILTGQILMQGVFERVGTSLATSFLGELWMNGGMFAVVIGTCAFAVGIRWLDFIGCKLLLDEVGQATSRAILCVVSFLTVRGDYISTTFRGLVIWVLACWLMIVLGRRAPSLAVSGSPGIYRRRTKEELKPD